MPGKYNYEKLYKYPHLLGEDKIIWERFIDSFPDRFHTVDYDIHVGTGIVPPEEADVLISDQWRNLTMKRIDVIGWKNNHATIIEVKRRVGLDTLGQVLGYNFLYKLQNPDIVSPSLLVVCARIDTDEVSLLKHFGIDFVQV